ncbi:oxidoreductase [Jannaschia sp. EhC01]|nr:oxidoreductase [Jannaschia sp. EhC01]
MGQTIVTDTGFAPDDWTGHAAPLAEGVPANGTAVDIAPSDDVAVLAGNLARLTFIRVAFPSSADGRGFTLAKRLRAMGYRGRLRAAGHVLADQYAMARRAGFDEVEIDAALAARQPEAQWLARADWHAHDYQARLRGSAA